MIKPRILLTASLLIPALYLAAALRADNAPSSTNSTTSGAPTSRPLVDISAAGSEHKFAADSQSNGQVTLSRSDNPPGVVVTVAPGTADYPGVTLKPEGGIPWDLSSFDHIEVTLTNIGKSLDTLPLAVRVDDSGGWQNNNSEVDYLKPGETKTIKVFFGFSYGKPAYAIKTSSLAQILICTPKTTGDPKSFRIESVIAANSAGSKP